MKCPHCLTAFNASFTERNLGTDSVYIHFSIKSTTCPECNRFIVYLKTMLPIPSAQWNESLLYPRGSSRAPVSKYVPEKFAGDYKEACTVLSDSAKASAALSRRCLQNILREMAGVKHSNLDGEIQQVLDSKTLPLYLASGIDAVRQIGNFAAHPIKSKSSGEIVDVEPGEAEWNLDVIEGLFDFYFVQSEELKSKRDALNKKLQDAGKPALKVP